MILKSSAISLWFIVDLCITVSDLSFLFILDKLNTVQDFVRYCECFASGTYCDGCNCNNCFNNVENEPARREAVEATLERNPNAFRPKIASSPHGVRDKRVCGLNKIDVTFSTFGRL